MSESFASRVKRELCKAAPASSDMAEAELYGMLLFASRFSESEVRVSSENPRVAARAALLVERLFSMQVRPSQQSESQLKSVLALSGDEARRIYAYYGYEGTSVALHLNAAVVEEEQQRAAFLRGVFLAAGVVTDPERGYHLELATRHYNLSREVVALLLDMDFAPKSTVRKSVYIIYFKDSAVIEDFLVTIGAVNGALEIMQTKAEKDLRNSVNRKVNCDTANIAKTVASSARQIAAIERLKASGAFEGLPDSLKAAALLRLESPEDTLAELARAAGVSRSGLNHRLKRLIEMGED